jgi:hypothetical protein
MSTEKSRVAAPPADAPTTMMSCATDKRVSTTRAKLRRLVVLIETVLW